MWSPERRLTDLPGDSRNPSLGVDRYGRIHLAWLYTEAASTQIRFMTFTYFSPFGMSLPVSGVTAVPDAPVVAVGPDGASRIFWSDPQHFAGLGVDAAYSPFRGGLRCPGAWPPAASPSRQWMRWRMPRARFTSSGR